MARRVSRPLRFTQSVASHHVGCQYYIVTQTSGVGVLDKAFRVVEVLADEPASLATLVERTGLSRATTYRLAVALEVHRFVARDGDGRFTLGPRLGELAGLDRTDPLMAAAGPVLERLRDITHESAQLYRRDGTVRRCIAAAERSSGLRDTVPVGAELPMTAGSAAQVLLAWSDDAAAAARAPQDLVGSRFSSTTLATVRRRGWAASVGEREAGVASVSAPVRDTAGRVVAAVSVSGPIDRLTRSPGRLHADAVLRAGEALSASLG
jgi:DNA-binding IclR family transcriptional regulator